jgi:hypothetical protein
MQDGFKRLFLAVNNISFDHKQSEISRMTIEKLKSLQKSQGEELKEAIALTATLQTERDVFRDEAALMTKKNTENEGMRLIHVQASRDKINKLEHKIKMLYEAAQTLENDLEKANRTIRILQDEKEKSRLKITKLLARKGNFDREQKICKNCAKEFTEKENFNWSCRTHMSEFGGEMWWCCGKRGKEQPGCKFNKHESREDDNSDGDDTNKQIALRLVRCICCKEQGHKIDDCPRDPNFKTSVSTNEDIARIAQIKNFKKLHADTIVNTTHFMKKSILVPLKENEDGNLTEPANAHHPFMRGILQFDDYNYERFNQYVLLEEPKNASIAAEIEMRERNKTLEQERASVSGKDAVPLSEKNLAAKERTQQSDSTYTHELITIEKSKLELEQEEIEQA